MVSLTGMRKDLHESVTPGHTSFPRRRESSTYGARFRMFAEWIPAFGGMTCGLGRPYCPNDTSMGLHEDLTKPGNIIRKYAEAGNVIVL
jgi:hypothetical protein